VCVNIVCMCAITFPVIESNDECAEKGEVYEYQEEEDQGQATQGKPSTCCICNSIPNNKVRKVSIVNHFFRTDLPFHQNTYNPWATG
jgi:hypothetical protein